MQIICLISGTLFSGLGSFLLDNLLSFYWFLLCQQQPLCLRLIGSRGLFIIIKNTFLDFLCQ